MSGVVVIVAYWPKPGKENKLIDLVQSRVPTLRKENLVTDRVPTIMRSRDGTIIEYRNGNRGRQSTPRIRIRACSRYGINSSQFATASRSTHWPKRTRCSQVSNRLPIEHWTLPP